MSKLLRLQDKLLIGLALAGDYLLPALLRAARGLPPYKLSSWSGHSNHGQEYKKQTFRNNVSQLLQTGEIEKVIKEGKPFFKLTNKGVKSLERSFPVFRLQKKKWNGYWSLVIFDFPEKERRLRNRLRDKLVELNFGMLQRSTYISPYDFIEDMAQFLASKKILGKAFVLKAEHRFMGDAQTLANHVWKLKDFNQQYLDIAVKANELRLKKSATQRKILKLKQKYLELITHDPFLPQELLPADWKREDAYQELIEVQNIL